MKNLLILFLLVTTLVLLGSFKEYTLSNHEQELKDISNKTYPKLFLLSKGLTTDTLKREFLNFLEKDPETLSVAVVVNASSTDKKKIKKTKKVKKQFDAIGFDSTKIKLFDLMKTAPQRLSDFDVIYILGGNPFLLLDEVNKSGAQSVFKELANQDKILMGYSAGSLLLGPDLSLFNQVDSLLGFNNINLEELTCIGLYDFHIFPHYSDFTGQVPELIKKIDQFELESNLSVYRLNDNQGIIYQNGEIKFIGE